MVPLDLFSKRQKKARGDTPEVFVYDTIPQPLRVQVVHIWRDVIGRSSEFHSPADNVYRRIVEALAREYGVFVLADGTSPEDVLKNFILSEREVDKILDCIEVSFLLIAFFHSRISNYSGRAHTKLTVEKAIEELNQRFLEHGVGYEYVPFEIIRKDSEFLHQETIKPALNLLQDSRYKGANEEFLKAHEHYRHGEIKDCLVYCLKSLESTLKTICEIRNWQFEQSDTAKTLLSIVFRNKLVPMFWQSHFNALKSTLESGVPTGRNKLGGHGQGSTVISVPAHFASYMLHMTGSAIQFLMNAEKVLP